MVSHRPEVHDAVVGQPGAWQEVDTGLRSAIAGDLFVVVHVVVVSANADSVAETVAHVARLGVPAVALSSPLRAASEEERQRLERALEEAQDAAYAHGLTMVWDLAAPYSYVNPIEMEAGLAPNQVIRQHLYVEPDGDVLPAQGYNMVLGNLLRDPWEAIWGHAEREKLGTSGA